MTATRQSSTTSPFNFLKEGLLLPSQNRRLFAAIFTIYVASYSLFLVAYEIGFQPLALKVLRDIYTLTSTNPRSPVYGYLLRKLHDDNHKLLLASVAYLLLAIVIGSVIQLSAVFAAVTTYSGEVHTFGTLLGKARAQLKGPVFTLAFVYALVIAAVSLLSVLAALLVFLAFNRHFELLLAGSLVLLVAYALYFYLCFVCSLGVVVAVAEPGRCGAGAVGRAWQLVVKGGQRRAILLMTVTSALIAVVSPFYWLTKICSVSGALLLGFLYTVLMAAVDLFGVCALTAFYYECKERADQPPEMEYVKLSIQDV
ncbi:unnamed protein product [Urochloa decumbens]|uniref:Uncharacterized protein n=1 Tax=Urochloa decumbens TaxID=240449 RepID=A0ABC9B3D1_9POAL